MGLLQETLLTREGLQCYVLFVDVRDRQKATQTLHFCLSVATKLAHTRFLNEGCTTTYGGWKPKLFARFFGCFVAVTRKEAALFHMKCKRHYKHHSFRGWISSPILWCVHVRASVCVCVCLCTHAWYSKDSKVWYGMIRWREYSTWSVQLSRWQTWILRFTWVRVSSLVRSGESWDEAVKTC